MESNQQSYCISDKAQKPLHILENIKHFQKCSVYKAIKILLVVSKLVTKPHERLHLVHPFLARERAAQIRFPLRICDRNLGQQTPHCFATCVTQGNRIFPL